MREVTFFCGSPFGCDGRQTFRLSGGVKSPPGRWACPKCGWESHSTARIGSEVLELAKAGKGEISPIDQQRILLRDLESRGKIDSKTAARHKRRLDFNERSGKYRVTDEDKRREDFKAMKAEMEEADADRQNPEPHVTVRDAVEAARVLGIVPENAG